ncbi:hypothetical protein V5O48_018071 [Marasmius crinis-equi]|uniref:G domain-containing protein n=1 Tax=Marasmius crinis-equi TaxID=585013 RepID=A0ABR3EM91_9AGAR
MQPQEMNDSVQDVVIAVMGTTGTGKSTFINAASGGKLLVGKGLRSCTDNIQVSPPFILGGRNVTLIDTPGFDDTTKSDTDILKLITAFLSETYKAGHYLSGIIYMHRITDVRMGGIASRNFRMFRNLCGEKTLKNVVIVTNRWEEVAMDLGEARERELMTDEHYFKPVLEKGAQMVRHNNTPKMARAILSHLLQNKPLPLRIQIEMVDEHKDLGETEAGAELNRELEELMKRHKQEMDELRKEFEEAQAARDDEWRQELTETKMKMEEAMVQMSRNSEEMRRGLNAQIDQLQRKFDELDRMAREEKEALERELSNAQRLAGVCKADIDRLKQDLKTANQRCEQLEKGKSKELEHGSSSHPRLTNCKYFLSMSKQDMRSPNQIPHNQTSDRDVRDVRVILVMGATGSGKTTFVNNASGGSLRIGEGLRSCTDVVQVSPSFYLQGQRVVIIDTPGFDDTTKSDVDIFLMIARYLKTLYEAGHYITGIVYVHRISDIRIGGGATRDIKLFRELCGEAAFGNALIVTNRWADVTYDVGQAREAELYTDESFFKSLIEGGANRARYDNPTKERAQGILSGLLSNSPLPLRIQTELVDERKKFPETAAGMELNRELLEQSERLEQEMKDLEKEMQDSRRDRDEQAIQELEVHKSQLQEAYVRRADAHRRLHYDSSKYLQNEAQDSIRDHDEQTIQELEVRRNQLQEDYARRVNTYRRLPFDSSGHDSSAPPTTGWGLMKKAKSFWDSL